MNSFFWLHDHIGWPFFGVLVYSVLCLLAGDIVWRVITAPFRKIFSIMVIAWTAGVIALIALWYV